LVQAVHIADGNLLAMENACKRNAGELAALALGSSDYLYMELKRI